MNDYSKILNDIFNVLTGCCIALWFIFLIVSIYLLFKFCDYYNENELKKRELLKKEILKEYENKTKDF